MNEETPPGAERASIAIGFVTSENTGPIPIVTKEFVDGLAHRYRFAVLNADREQRGRRMGRFTMQNLLNFWVHGLRWVKLLAVNRPKVAHYPVTSFWNMEKSLVFLWIARRFGARTVGHLHGGAFLDFWSRLGRLRRSLAAAQLRELDAFVVLSEGWKRATVDTLGLEASRVFVVPNPIDRVFEHEALSFDPSRETRTLLALGVMGEGKGVFDIVEAAHRCLRPSGWNLVIAGPDRVPGTTEKVRRLVEAHSLAEIVALRGGVWGEKKRDLFQSSSILLLPSYYENLPLVVLEAAAAGMAIVATPVGALPELFVDRESILFVEPGNPQQLSEAITHLTQDEAFRVRLGTAAREVFQRRMGRERILEELDIVYRKVLAGS
jgi:glycosyltransferase involved in cell wall biosynthesis